jgi:hypothetical protein
MRENNERWKLLCEMAAQEQDPQKLLELTRKINDLLLGNPTYRAAMIDWPRALTYA